MVVAFSGCEVKMCVVSEDDLEESCVTWAETVTTTTQAPVVTTTTQAPVVTTTTQAPVVTTTTQAPVVTTTTQAPVVTTTTQAPVVTTTTQAPVVTTTTQAPVVTTTTQAPVVTTTTQPGCFLGILCFPTTTTVPPTTTTLARVDGSCKAYGGTYSSQPASSKASGCNSGSYSNVSDSSTQWKWSCNGLNGGASDACVANKPPVATTTTQAPVVTTTIPSCPVQDSASCGSYGSALYQGRCDQGAFAGWRVRNGQWETCSNPTPTTSAPTPTPTTSAPTPTTSAPSCVCDPSSSSAMARVNWNASGGGSAICNMPLPYATMGTVRTITDNDSSTSTGSAGSNGSITLKCDYRAATGQCQWFPQGTQTCSAPTTTTLPAVNGKCATPSFSNYGYQSQPVDSSNGCAAGTFIEVADSSTQWLWRCEGRGGGGSENCAAAKFDSDGDSIVDEVDSCALQKGPSSNSGCPTACRLYLGTAGNYSGVGNEIGGTVERSECPSICDSTWVNGVNVNYSSGQCKYVKYRNSGVPNRVPVESSVESLKSYSR